MDTAVELIEGRPESAHDLASLARATHVSARSLQKAYRRELDTSVVEYVRGARLQHARRELLSAQPDTATVAAVAYRWGFAHPGRFSIWYRQRFGESPSQTLRRPG
ncbi:helix-turn-helix domain-containing protein [Amycolatopsis alkalitolerans]|uniref:helix-turn-helix domain-containing protein n=1 Tax=Amycolatopsis alkalitolerans TaxID=2547244 RepID=UPI00135B9C5C|nr:helix-turn-helix domain-containing protein [Amycolatopsis alkalitolerans]